jgi:hypothetical protein
MKKTFVALLVLVAVAVWFLWPYNAPACVALLPHAMSC